MELISISDRYYKICDILALADPVELLAGADIIDLMFSNHDEYQSHCIRRISFALAAGMIYIPNETPYLWLSELGTELILDTSDSGRLEFLDALTVPRNIPTDLASLILDGLLCNEVVYRKYIHDYYREWTASYHEFCVAATGAIPWLTGHELYKTVLTVCSCWLAREAMEGCLMYPWMDSIWELQLRMPVE